MVFFACKFPITKIELLHQIFSVASWVFKVEGNPIPISGAVWFLGSGLIAISGLRKKLKRKNKTPIGNF
jgi:hypothetical protein